jgi:transcriptional regulator with XRE-family HTH domain
LGQGETGSRLGIPSTAFLYGHRAGTGPMTTNTALLEALADFFGVPVSYLTEEDSAVPERVQAQLDLLRSMREAEVKTLAARSLTKELSTETLLEIRDMGTQA